MKIDQNLALVAQSVRLTDRQAEVLGRIARRASIKQIASELKVSETRVNQHIRSLKSALGVETLAELQAIHNAVSDGCLSDAYRKPVGRKEEVTPLAPSGESEPRNDTGHPLLFQDSMTYTVSAPWAERRMPRVVPGVLNGANGALIRSILLVTLAAMLFVVVLVGLGVAQGVSGVLGSGNTAPGNRF